MEKGLKDRLFIVVMLLFNAVFVEAQEALHNSLREGEKGELAEVDAGKEPGVNDRAWYIPGQYKLQYAGSIGFMSLGFGYEVTPTYQPALFVGYLSKDFGGSENRVLSVSLKNTFYFTKEPLFKYFNPYGGLSINWGNTNNTFRSLPDYYPDEYYFQNKVHFAPFVGGELYFNLKQSAVFKGAGVYAEFSAFDAYLLEAIRTRYVKPHMALSLAIGVTFYID